jgi:hypothetical protein
VLLKPVTADFGALFKAPAKGIGHGEEVHALSLANLEGEYCTVLSTQEAIRLLPRSPCQPNRAERPPI